MSAPDAAGPEEPPESAFGVILPVLGGCAVLVFGLLGYFLVTGPPELDLRLPVAPETPPAQGGPKLPGGGSGPKSGSGPLFGGIKFYSPPELSGLRTEVDWRQRESEIYSKGGEPGEVEWKLYYVYDHPRCPYRSESMALGHLESAASLGYGPALLGLGQKYAAGRGVYKDPSRARSLLEEARKKGMTQAGNALAELDKQQ